MCNVCCAGHAVKATEAGSFATFQWQAREEGDRNPLVNNMLAPPMNDAPAEDPKRPVFHLRVQAKMGDTPENKRFGVEGPGRYRVRFDEPAEGADPDAGWSPWFDSDDLSGAMSMLGVDVAYAWLFDDPPAIDVDGEPVEVRYRRRLVQSTAVLEPDIGPLIVRGDLGALVRFIEDEQFAGRKWAEGYEIGRKLLYQGTPTKAGIERVDAFLSDHLRDSKALCGIVYGVLRTSRGVCEKRDKDKAKRRGVRP